MLLGKAIADLVVNDITALQTNGVPESKHLDYKLTLPGPKNSDRKEFVDDVCSLVNAGGGHLLFGIEEETDASGKSTGRPAALPGLHGINRDHEVLRLDQMILTNISPRVRHRWSFIDGFAKGAVAVLEIDRSWVGPHITTHSASRFVTRGGAGKYHMDIDEIRAAFAGTASTSTQLRAFHEGRVSHVMNAGPPIPLEAKALVLVHMLPLSALSGVGEQVDPRAWAHHQHKLWPLGASGCNNRYNIDGYLTYSGNAYQPSEDMRSYLQTFRNGALESASCRFTPEHNGHRLIPSTKFETDLIRFVHEKLEVMADVDAETPAVVMASLVGMKGVRLAVDNHGRSLGEPIDRNILTLPHVLFEEMPTDIHEVARSLRPLFDGVWQANGHPGCSNYDSDGNWRVNRR